MPNIKLTTDNITLDNIGSHYIELQHVTSSGDTLQFNSDWAHNNDIFYVNTGKGNLPLNKDIPNGKPYGQGSNGGDKVYAEIDAFRLDDAGNLTVDVFPMDKLSLENAANIKDQSKRNSTISKVKLHQMPIAYLTDNYVPQKNSDGSVKKDSNGNVQYQIDSNRPKTVVYRSRSNYHDPYNGTPDWYRKRVLTNDSHNDALALIESLDYYLRGVQFVNYDYYAPTTISLVDDILDESAYKVVPSANGLDGIDVDNAKIATLRPNGVMSDKYINAGGIQDMNNGETGEDVQLNTVNTGTDKNEIKDVDPSALGSGILGDNNGGGSTPTGAATTPHIATSAPKSSSSAKTITHKANSSNSSKSSKSSK